MVLAQRLHGLVLLLTASLQRLMTGCSAHTALGILQRLHALLQLLQNPLLNLIEITPRTALPWLALRARGWRLLAIALR